MTRKSTGTYPTDWKAIAQRVKDEAGWQCVRCGHPHNPKAGRTLTVHHLDINPENCRWWNLAALCQACHLSIQGRVYMDRPWVMAEHSAWFKPYAAGFYAWKYAGLDLDRDDVMSQLDELLSLEAVAVLGVCR